MNRKILVTRRLQGLLVRVLALATALVLLGLVGCVDFPIDDEQYICRTQSECGEGFTCLRGPGCYCVCKPLGEPAQADCTDPLCENVATQ